MKLGIKISLKKIVLIGLITFIPCKSNPQTSQETSSALLLEEFSRMVTIFENMDPYKASKIWEELYKKGSKETIEDILFHPSLSPQQAGKIISYMDPLHLGNIFSNQEYNTHEFHKLALIFSSLPANKIAPILEEITFLSSTNAGFIVKEMIKEEAGMKKIGETFGSNHLSASSTATLLSASSEGKEILTFSECIKILKNINPSSVHSILEKLHFLAPQRAQKIKLSLPSPLSYPPKKKWFPSSVLFLILIFFIAIIVVFCLYQFLPYLTKKFIKRPG